MHNPLNPDVLPMRDGVSPSCVVLPSTGTGSMLDPRPLSAVTIPFSQRLNWDLADNLTEVTDLRDGAEWPAGYRPQSTTIGHDALYRVVRADYTYPGDSGATLGSDAASDWRSEAELSRPNDPMRGRPAGMVGDLPDSRPMYMSWEYDWLGNAETWDDDSGQFYERSLGDITNGFEAATVDRPGSLRIASNLGAADATGDHGGYAEVDYGEAGEVRSFTVHAECVNVSATQVCTDGHSPYPATRLQQIRTGCRCLEEQHYFYRWDEVMRIAEGYRFDRTGGTGTWTMMVRQRYLYDSANERTVKQTLDLDVMSSTPEAVALYVYPGDFERRGLVRNAGGTSYTALPGAETQYVVGGARLVWRTPTRNPAIGIDRDQRLTIGLSDLIQSTSATLDLLTGELVETSNYYANGARESYRASTNGDRVAPEPMGFTGKEADEEVGLTYFGQRYLMSHLGRWASPDPLQTHAVGGGEALNGYHYVAGNVLQARDPQGLSGCGPPPPPTQQVFISSTSGSFWDNIDRHGFEIVPDGAVSRADLTDMLRAGDRGDIVVFEGHGDTDHIIPSDWWGMDEQPMDNRDVYEAVREDESAPSVVILATCESAGASATDPDARPLLLESLVEGGVGVAFGWAGTVNTAGARAAARVLVERLTAGDTIREATDEANRAAEALADSGTAGRPPELRFELGEGVDPDLSLEANGLGLPPVDDVGAGDE